MRTCKTGLSVLEAKTRLREGPGMRLSLSVRIAEGFLSKEEATMNLPSVCRLAAEAGYDALCMRASQVGVHSSADDRSAAVAALKDTQMPVSMVTADFATVYNNDQGPESLRAITPYLDFAEGLGAKLIRVALKKEEDISHAQRAAAEAAERDITLVHQCHCLSLFETVEGIEATLKAIDHPNFGLIFEAANLEECGQSYGADTIKRLAPWIRNVYLQNQVIKPDGAVTLETWCRGSVRFDIIPIPQPGGIDFEQIIAGLKAIGYDGSVTVHQSGPEDGSGAAGAVAEAKATADYLRPLVS